MLVGEKKVFQRRINMSPPQVLALSFIMAIILGTFLLKLPIATTAPIS